MFDLIVTHMCVTHDRINVAAAVDQSFFIIVDSIAVSVYIERYT